MNKRRGNGYRLACYFDKIGGITGGMERFLKSRCLAKMMRIREKGRGGKIQSNIGSSRISCFGLCVDSHKASKIART